ncbi:VOC family protein [Streptomyces flaveus]|uniref:Extradiol dioxygenase n=1 Tax=Streptomyces flaveus TaxID=66370 RepID=A0A917QXU5_9ACTN|nr:VOC family protein [Streptomyces flaveus]GGK76142.1 extradiol dioxygenase [Streptomyces flaveus]
MDFRAFPVVHTRQVSAVAAFYEQLGFARHTQHPDAGEPGFVGLRRGPAEIAVSGISPPAPRGDHSANGGDRWEMFVFVEEVDAAVERLRRAGAPVLSEPVDMPWGERVAYVTDPDGNRVAVASPAKTADGAA